MTLKLQFYPSLDYLDTFVDGFGHTFTSNSSVYAYQADDECPGSADLNSIR